MKTHSPRHFGMRNGVHYSVCNYPHGVHCYVLLPGCVLSKDKTLFSHSFRSLTHAHHHAHLVPMHTYIHLLCKFFKYVHLLLCTLPRMHINYRTHLRLMHTYLANLEHFV